MPHFDDITLLVTHYNRSTSLERLLKNFSDLDCSFGDIVVSDDGSKQEHVDYINSLKGKYKFTLVTTPKNKGLGNNINKGQDAVKTPYTLYVQEDFVPQQIFPGNLKNALSYMNERKELDFVRFYAYFKYPWLKPYKNGFSDMVFKIWNPGYKKFYYYSDHPHLRRTTFFERFGRYPEGLKVEVTEYRMMMQVLKAKGKGLFYDDYTANFDQVNSSAEPSTVRRNFWRETENPLISLSRHLYRHLKFNFDYLLGK
ncbi:glycosyltransferase [Dyadobacter luticola]|uniref:Glycosyltransferase family 2 protein n=1 Tax=Dyadobacter luticola TaxID=1979387 RepID=A0A5R9L2G2_9BACT|nr:glycosyltransferase [Dyadobacter luticola]TLV02598.1 glycosyltransferase family 2 protein [Dyadobacter luticola]